MSEISGKTHKTTCNCNFGCPCQFSAPPTHGHCRAAAGCRIEKGHWGSTSLDGVTFIGLLAWPGAIHERKGTAHLVLDEATSEAQRQAVTALFMGEETEPGATIFNVFSSVIDTYHDPIVRPITFEADIASRKGRFHVPGLIEGSSEPIRDPVMGEEQRIQVTLPNGFEYHMAEYASSTVHTDESLIPLEWRQGHAHFARIEMTPRGVVHG